jgi:hypothetical protein
MSVDPVFFDKSGRRWRVVKLMLFFGAVMLIALPCFLVVSIEKVSTPSETSFLTQDEQLTTGSVGRAVYRDPPTVRAWRGRSQTRATADLD